MVPGPILYCHIIFFKNNSSQRQYQLRKINCTKIDPNYKFYKAKEYLLKTQQSSHIALSKIR